MEQKSVLIGMSGGVDSSVAAALLKEQGYHVIGATMRLWTYSDSCNMKHEGCCAESAVEDARRVCDKLGIDFYVMNFKDMFKDKVVDYFVDEYIHGRTPNPCIACNKYLKFDALLKKRWLWVLITLRQVTMPKSKKVRTASIFFVQVRLLRKTRAMCCTISHKNSLHIH